MLSLMPSLDCLSNLAQTWQRARELSRRHGPALGSGALDTIHVVSALVLGAEDFYTFDRGQA